MLDTLSDRHASSSSTPVVCRWIVVVMSSAPIRYLGPVRGTISSRRLAMTFHGRLLEIQETPLHCVRTAVSQEASYCSMLLDNFGVK